MSVTSNIKNGSIQASLKGHIKLPELVKLIPNCSKPTFMRKEYFPMLGKSYQFLLICIAESKGIDTGFGLLKSKYDSKFINRIVKYFLEDNDYSEGIKELVSNEGSKSNVSFLMPSDLVLSSYALAYLDSCYRRGVHQDNIKIPDVDFMEFFMPFSIALNLGIESISKFANEYILDDSCLFQKTFSKGREFGGADCFCINLNKKAIVSTCFSFSSNALNEDLLYKNITYAILALLDGYEVDKIVINFPNHSQTIEFFLSELHSNFRGFIRKILGFNLLPDSFTSKQKDYLNF